MKTTAWSAGLVLLGMAAIAPGAHAQSDCTKTVPVSPFGAGDQTGATNRVTPTVTKAAAAEIQTGKVTTMTNPLTISAAATATTIRPRWVSSSTRTP